MNDETPTKEKSPSSEKQKPRTLQISTPYFGEAERQAVLGPLETGWVTQGPRVRAFEDAFKRRLGVPHALATTSCTTGLQLILAALEIGPGDEVIVPAFTWIATANVVVHAGARPVFVDIDPATFNLDVSKVEAAITERTRAIIAVHLFGLAADMDGLRAVAGELPVIEDAACAVGAAIGDRPAGTLGVAASFSFHPRKIITTGEGGMVTTSDSDLAETLEQLRNHGASVPEEVRHRGPKPYLLPDFKLAGFNFRMTDIQGALGLAQLARLPGFLEERGRFARHYQEQLAGLEWLRTPQVPEGYTHGWQSFVCTVDEERSPLSRNRIMERLQAQGISTRPGTHALHTLEVFQVRHGFEADDFPESARAERTSLAIPLHNSMTLEDCDRVVRALGEIA